MFFQKNALDSLVHWPLFRVKMWAKPILDIAIGISADTPMAIVFSAIQSIGYHYGGDLGETGGDFFIREADPHVRTHHVHVVDETGRQGEEYLRLRDFLRTHPEARQAYFMEKELLAKRYANDREGYTAAKEKIVGKLLTEAQQSAT